MMFSRSLRITSQHVRVLSKAQQTSYTAPAINGIRSTLLTANMSTSSTPTVSFDLKDAAGNSTKVHIKPSYPEKPKAIANLVAALPNLITDAVMPTSRISTFATSGWDLDESQDTIHRYIELESEIDIAHVIDQIKSAAQALNHDPHIYHDGKRLTISCTTHVPAGLSMKDVKLARKIDEILAGTTRSQRIEYDEAEILTQRQRAREHNMEEVRKAKLSCDCG